MDPDDLALIQQYLGQRGPQDPTLHSHPGQAFADAIQDYATARGEGPLGAQLDPEQLQACQAIAEGVRQYALQRSQLGEPLDPAFTAPPPFGFPSVAPPGGWPSDPKSGAVLLADRSYGRQPPSTDSSPFLPSLAPALRSPPMPQLPSPAVRAAAADELRKRGVNPNADYYPSENDALANLARGRAAPSWDPAPQLPAPAIGQHGYQPAPGDENTLARIIYAEGSNTPEDYGALGWSVVNRIGASRHWKTLDDVVFDPGQFDSVKNGGSARWRDTADPSKMNSSNAKAWQYAQRVAHGILAGAVQDPTGGAKYFFSSPDLDGDALKAASAANSPWFYNRLKNGDFQAAQYQGHIGQDINGPRRNYFTIESPKAVP
jgi:spore germination cell wall hydrolase CwlJ-like protein